MYNILWIVFWAHSNLSLSQVFEFQMAKAQVVCYVDLSSGMYNMTKSGWSLLIASITCNPWCVNCADCTSGQPFFACLRIRAVHVVVMHVAYITDHGRAWRRPHSATTSWPYQVCWVSWNISDKRNHLWQRKRRPYHCAHIKIWVVVLSCA